tara:strand:- start:836 stop:1069 length:234 start_codon:yes stop_codon:yes gene_type:complete
LPGSADRLKRIRIIKQFFENNLKERFENDEISFESVQENILNFYKSQSKIIPNFKKTANTRREDIQAALEELGVLTI